MAQATSLACTTAPARIEHDQAVLDRLDHGLGLGLLVQQGADVQALEFLQAPRHLIVLVRHLLQLRDRLRPERRIGAAAADAAQPFRQRGQGAGHGARQRPPQDGDQQRGEEQRGQRAEEEAIGHRPCPSIGREHGVLVERDEPVEVAQDRGRVGVDTRGRRPGQRRVEQRPPLSIDAFGELGFAGFRVVAVLDADPVVELRAPGRTDLGGAAIARRQLQAQDRARHAVRRLDAAVVPRQDVGDRRLQDAQARHRHQRGEPQRRRQAHDQQPHSSAQGRHDRGP